MGARICVGEGDAPVFINVYAGASSEPDVFRRIESEPMVAADLECFAGQFWSQELAALYHIAPAAHEVALTLTRRGHEPSTLYPVGNNTFTTGFFVNQISLEFEQDSGGGIAGFRLSSLRTRGIQFTRAPFQTT